ncbi:hypothetical protein PHLGIDRAFT_237217 [Phlebiopsis gigantea 11061_1 CR5-6]|uniref:Uncharacterized protein n=1 Tax=Phlebiopsis gigantea (strain 11061_1 CR5-6) TaxID=745531 RepID=A0A0C3S5E7_PHLG1|nr:hypothetical protein PHLGIDRAFT_237217 [Phlebiopsis gigantea 11061_1 CR5-6]
MSPRRARSPYLHLASLSSSSTLIYYYYSNPNGSTYYNSGSGHSQYTAPSGGTSKSGSK